MKRRPAENGSALIEGALTFTIFIMLVFGIMDLCRLMWWYNGLPYLAREGTRFAAVRGSTSSSPAAATDVTTAVTAKAIGYQSSNLSVSTTWIPDNNPGSAVRVTVAYPFRPLVPYVPSGTITLSSISQLTITQ